MCRSSAAVRVPIPLEGAGSVRARPSGIAHIEVIMNLFLLKSWLQARLGTDDRGATLVEYILLVALIALAVIAAVVFMRGQVSSKFDQTGSHLSSGS
jgi:pilus assembly protein Flp/PilA